MEKEIKAVEELQVEELDFSEVEQIEEVATPVFVGTIGCCA